MQYSVGEISWSHSQTGLAETTADSDGRFRLEYGADHAPFADGERFLQSILVVTATAPGYGPSFSGGWYGEPEANPDREIKLIAAKLALRGQILDLEGRPVRGAQLRVIGISQPHDQMQAWFEKAKLNPREADDSSVMLSKIGAKQSAKPQAVYFNQGSTHAIPSALAGPFTSDEQGRVDLGQWGDHRLLQLELTAPGIAKSWVQVITYPMPPVPAPGGDPRFLANSYFGADFRLTVEPEQVIRGKVTDIDSGAAVAGAVVRLHQFGGNLLGISGFVAATTDSQGNYELHGLAKPKQPDAHHKLEVYPGPDSHYFRTETVVPQQLGLSAVTHDIALRRGVWLSGRATEKGTGKPVRGAVSFYPFLDNTNAKEYANFISGMTSMGYDDRYTTANDGSFRLPAIAGRGVLVFMAEELDNYPAGEGVEQIAGLKSADKSRKLNLYHFGFSELANAIREVNIAPEEVEEHVTVELSPLATFPIRFVDDQGAPVDKVRAQRLQPSHPGRGRYNGWGDVKAAGPIVALRGFEELKRMPVIALSRDKRLGAVRDFRQADFVEGKTFDWKLEPCATVQGRLVDEADKPLAGLTVSARWNPFSGEESRGWSHWEHNTHSLPTDTNGKFSLPELPPGAAYELSVHSEGLGRIDLGTTDLLAPGALLDKGTLRCKPVAEGEEEGVNALSLSGSAKDSNAAVASESTTIKGQVTDANGKPVAGADVAVIAT
ncbi:MAG: carboxypeptidase-like regulatory domain-containing protein, partial [Singulisphaera sp.]